MTKNKENKILRIVIHKCLYCADIKDVKKCKYLDNKIDLVKSLLNENDLKLFNKLSKASMIYLEITKVIDAIFELELKRERDQARLAKKLLKNETTIIDGGKNDK